jgi:hypothetical protein
MPSATQLRREAAQHGAAGDDALYEGGAQVRRALPLSRVGLKIDSGVRTLRRAAARCPSARFSWLSSRWTARTGRSEGGWQLQARLARSLARSRTLAANALHAEARVAQLEDGEQEVVAERTALLDGQRDAVRARSCARLFKR